MEGCILRDIGDSYGSGYQDDKMVPFNRAKEDTIARFEREYVTRVLRRSGGNVTRAAKLAGKNRRAFWEIMHKHNISRHA